MELLDFAIQTAEKAGKILQKEAKKTLQIKEKAANDIVTQADLASEKTIIATIQKAYPDHGILAEEDYSLSKNSNNNTATKLNKSANTDYSKYKYIWIVDPLDGTINFSHRQPIYSVSIALFKTSSKEKSRNFDYLSGEIVTGVIYAPAMNEIFYAQKGKGAFLNGKKIQVSAVKNFHKALTVTGFPPTHKEKVLPHFKVMLKNSQAVRRLGSAALDLCWVAAGRFDLFWEFGLKPWDVAAGSLIVSEAGGKVTDINGNLLDLFGADILATNRHLHTKAIKEFQSM